MCRDDDTATNASSFILNDTAEIYFASYYLSRVSLDAACGHVWVRWTERSAGIWPHNPSRRSRARADRRGLYTNDILHRDGYTLLVMDRPAIGRPSGMRTSTFGDFALSRNNGATYLIVIVPNSIRVLRSIRVTPLHNHDTFMTFLTTIRGFLIILLLLC